MQDQYTKNLKKSAPRKQWQDLISKKDPDLLELKTIITNNPPDVAELLIESSCSHSCKHCIYPKDYHKHNQTLPVQTWKSIIDKLITDFGITRIVFVGRGLSQRILDVATYCKTRYPKTHLGVIFDAPVINDLLLNKIQLAGFNQIDISLDGLEKEHDSQRDYPGSFKQTIDLLMKLKDLAKQGRITKYISLLSCITTINIDSIPEMINFLGKLGYLNICMNPITIEGNHPDPSLSPTIEQYRVFVANLEKLSRETKDLNIIFNIFDHKQVEMFDNLSEKLIPERYDMVSRQQNKSKLKLAYAPESITPCRELIINSDGEIITAKSIALKQIPDHRKFGNFLELPSHINDAFSLAEYIAEHPSFKYYEDIFLEESILQF